MLEVRYSPTLAGAMVDALPYLAEYPYNNTESTLNRFLPSVITPAPVNGQPATELFVDFRQTEARWQYDPATGRWRPPATASSSSIRMVR